ncbi:methionine import ATP-binding protein MetN [Bartonella bacilliformis Peru38]|uniref:Cell division ATP-binding protein FtsE n=2 Tax=Bartonella bacilliformis TaxID=774 RepID=A1UTR2_BARBK|nr:ATP-binding cassette domain-containing protein [Bartonella bacilliformis]ABM44757.1 D-methionine ABC transporter, ATP-binding protein [Bartonella bacilliformis KC583]AMG86115.1 methionine ABC transporter ATP-binding protein [Bartonella bacilliformis]EKS43360.1 D-methionine ABC transporter, ATP-binding protein [Bartonella bacilliformis INS]EYS88658.1 methionine import ATP-binding protein MetN [Bartonella bacilliformis San Pedro600-02]KEG19756.1 methionine import ATP-binding protein MetN [Bar
MENPALISLKNVRHCFSKTAAIPALNNLSLDIHAGEILGIIGRSGAGKSTLMRCLNGLEKINEGKLFFEGVNISNLSETEWAPYRRHIGMIFQHFNLLSSQKVIDNIALPLKLAGINKKQRHKRAFELIELVGLCGKEHHYPSELSGGQKQRVGIARSLAANPKILLSDEATSALDPETTQSILELLADINHRLNLTIVLITHEMEVVRTIAHRVVVLNQGSIVEKGRVKDIFTSPQEDTTIAMLKLVTPQLPKKIAQKLKPSGQEAVIEINIDGEIAQQPFLNLLEDDIGLRARILHGGIDTVQGETIGRLFLGLPSQDKIVLEQAVKWLTEKGRYCEVLGYV